MIVMLLNCLPDVRVGVHVVPELAEERVLVDEVGGEAIEDAALEPPEQPPHGDVRHSHGLSHEEARRAVVLEVVNGRVSHDSSHESANSQFIA